MNLLWRPGATEDRYAIYDYLDRESPNAAILIDDRILKAAEWLRDHPEMGRIGRRRNTRELVVRKTSYLIVYRVIDETVEILRVIHGRQRWPSARQISNPARKM